MDEIHELQRIELGILLDVAALCREHGIPFFLGEGTLLGAVRHHGFIPWDDDVDLLMMREDYERFLTIAPAALAPKYEVQHPTTVKNYWSPFIKVRLVEGEQKYRQQHIAHLTDHNGPYIDIFPMESVPSDHGFGHWLQGQTIRVFRTMLTLKLGLRPPLTAKQRVVGLFAVLFPVGTIHRVLHRAFTWYNGRPGNRFTATLASYQSLRARTAPSSVYERTQMLPFEGHPMPVPGEYDFLLTHIYGDYMTPPPPEKRVIKHSFNSAEYDG